MDITLILPPIEKKGSYNPFNPTPPFPPLGLASIAAVLEKNGYNVVMAVNTDDCLKKLENEEQKPDLILMDIMMSGTPVREIIPKLKGIKIAYLTVVRASETEIEELMKSKNTVDFIQKPFDVNNLLERVKKIVG